MIQGLLQNPGWIGAYSGTVGAASTTAWPINPYSLFGFSPVHGQFYVIRADTFGTHVETVYSIYTGSQPQLQALFSTILYTEDVPFPIFTRIRNLSGNAQRNGPLDTWIRLGDTVSGDPWMKVWINGVGSASGLLDIALEGNLDVYQTYSLTLNNQMVR